MTRQVIPDQELSALSIEGIDDRISERGTLALVAGLQAAAAHVLERWDAVADNQECASIHMQAMADLAREMHRRGA